VDAADASFELDGVPTLSSTNLVSLQGGKVQLTACRSAPGVEVSVVVGADEEAVTRSVVDLAVAASDFACFLNDHPDALSSSFVNSYSATIQGLAPALARVAISVARDNRLAVDPATFREVLRDDAAAVRAAIASPNGLAHRVGRFANEVLASPISWFGAPSFIPPVAASTRPVTPAVLLANNTLSSLLYAQLFSQGLFINTHS
ncbi:MAG: hypothetical protein ACYDAG_09575, partial [Chloroflexota bacterium]